MFQMAAQYPPEMTEPMKAELTRLGVESLESEEAVTTALARPGTTLVVVNSVCGCAAGGARPGVAKALQNAKQPDHAVTVFAGVDKPAVAAARAAFKGYAPSSPQIALLKDGEVAFILERGHIEGRTADMIAADLSSAFDRFC